MAGEGPGVVEIKCPYNRGSPGTAKPYATAPHYYMPQVEPNHMWCKLAIRTRGMQVQSALCGQVSSLSLCCVLLG